MNGNANLNANNLTAQNVQDWRNKLGIGGGSGINTIASSSIRISDYNSGLYELTYDGEKTIYYSANSTSTTSFKTSSARFLSITKIITTGASGTTTTEWDWIITGGTSVFQGYSQMISTLSVVTYAQNYFETDASITTTTSKRYLLGSQNSINVNKANALNTNTSCYMQSGKLYSGGSIVALKSETMMPSDSYTNYTNTPTANATLLTAPSNGYAYMRYYYTGSGIFDVNLTSSSNSFLANQYVEYSNGKYINLVFAMKKGQKLRIVNATGTLSWGSTMFVSVSGT